MSKTRSKVHLGGSHIRLLAMGSASCIALLLGSAPAFAQVAASEPVEQVVVSSTRIQSAGFDAPTPTTVVNSADLASAAETNVFTTITQLPVLEGSIGTQSGNGGASLANNGLSSLALRGLGTIRTLVLFDGQRVVPANVTGINDISEFPQLLISRVDVVTGGASASYGSDAVAGVVNFITDKKFEGFKVDASGGVSTYGDNQTVQFRTAGGTSFMGGRAHVEGSFEYTYESGINGVPLGVANGPNGRTWYIAPNFLQTSIAATAAGQPQLFYATNTQNFQFATNGLITSGPLQGTAFGTNGQPYQFVYGSNGVPSKAANGAVSGCKSPYCIGGDNSANYLNDTALIAATTRGNAYARVSYDIGEKSEVYANVMLSEVATHDPVTTAQREPANLTIQCDNAFLPASITAACAANKITSFGYGTEVYNITPNAAVVSQRALRRYVVGSDGALDIFGQQWTYDAYFEHGENDTTVRSKEFILNPHFQAAIDAVAGPNGTIVCRSAIAQAAGCIPLNIIGNVPLSAAARAFSAPELGEYSSTAERQESASVVLNGEPIKLWAGPLAVATGLEYREEAYSVVGDPYGAGVTSITPNNAQYPADALLSSAGSNWYAGNYHNGSGNYHVTEEFVDLGIPLIDSPTWGKADMELAGRATEYSTSGYVQTWKTGLTWQTPLDGVKLRGLFSRDVRAPNLSELFAAPTVAHSTVVNDATNTSVVIVQNVLGNTALKPEKSQTTELGIVFQPSWLEGFNASIDYWRVAVKQQISTLTGQQEEDTCFNSGGTSPVCAAVQLTAPTPTVTTQAFNLSAAVTDGFDFEASQQFALDSWNIPGDFVVRALVTHTSKFITNTGIFGLPISESAGNNTGSTPLWRLRATENWNVNAWNFTLTERWFSDGVFNKNYITCTSSCPVPTFQNPTVNLNTMAGAFYLDFGASYKVNGEIQIYTKVDNLLNKDPVPSPGGVNGTNSTLYDVVGRMFHVGVRYSN